MAAFGQLSGDSECVWASQIFAINDHGGLVLIGVFDQHFVFRDVFIEIFFRETDRARNVIHFVEKEWPNIKDQSGFALGKLIESSKRHSGDGSRCAWCIDYRSGGFNRRE